MQGADIDRASFKETVAENLELVKPQRTFPANGDGRQLLTARQEEQLVQAQKMAEQVGARFVLDQSIRGGTANGYYQDGVIHVAADAQNAAMVVFKMKLTHHLQQTAPQEYNAFKAAAVEVAGESVVQETMRKYALQGVPLSVEEAMDEVAADFTEKLLTDSKSIQQLINTKPTLADRFFAALRELLQRMTGRMDPKLKQAEKLWTEAYQVARGNKNTAEENGGVKYSIVKDGEGNPRVIVDRDIFQGVDAADRPQKLKEFLMNNLRGEEYTALSDGEILSVAQKNQTLGKMWRPGHRVHEEKYHARLDAASHLDEIIEASEWKSTEENKKPLERPNRGNVDKRTVTVEIPVWDEAGNLADTQVWDVTLTVPQDKRTGRKTAYDLQLVGKKERHPFRGVLPQMQGAAIDRASFKETIAENLELVKPQRTFPANGDGRQLLTAKQEEELRQAQRMEEEINTAKEDGGVKYSIVKDGEGNPRVIVDRDIFQGVDAADRPQKLKEFLMNNLRGQEYTALSDGEILSVAQKNQTLQKIWRPGYPVSEEKYHARLDAASHLDEIIEASEWESTEENKKPLERPNRGDVDKRTVTVEIPVWDEAGNLADTQVWDVTLVVPQDKRTGRKTAYDLLLREKKKDAHSARTFLQMQETANDRASFQETIAENLELVKPQRTFPANGDGRQLLTAKQEEELRQAQRMAEQEKKRYSINERFRNDVMEWHREGEPFGERFILGDTGPVLQGLGAIESDIYMNGDKISKIMHDHPEITIREIQRIPEILEDPVLILKSRNAGRGEKENTRMVLFGSIKAQSGRPVLCVLDLRPRERRLVLDDMQKVTSAYTKDNKPVEFVENSDVLYADKKRTTRLLSAIGFQMPIACDRSGYIGSIAYARDNVKLKGVPFSSVVKSGANSQKKFSIKEDGGELKHLRSERKEVRNQIGNLEWLEERNNGLSDADAAELRGLREQERMLNEKIEQAREAAKETELPEAERIRAAAEHAAEEVKPTEAYKSLRAALLDTFHVQAGNRKDLGNQIDHVAQQILEKGYVTASDEAELYRALYNAGVVVDTFASESYAGIRKDLRKAKIYVDDTVRAEMGDDWNDMRKRAFANGIILTTDSNTGQGIDQLHADLADYYPGMFDAQSTDRTAMLEEMISAAEMGKPEHISLMEAAMRAEVPVWFGKGYDCSR